MNITDSLSSIYHLYVQPSQPDPKKEAHLERSQEREQYSPRERTDVPVLWPTVEAPDRTICEVSSTPYTTSTEEIPLWAISVSTIFLEAAAHLRDTVLSYDNPSLMISFAKLAAVVTITLTASALFQASNITEIALRSMVFTLTVVFSAVMLSLAAFGVKQESVNETVGGIIGYGTLINVGALAGIIHGCAQILTPLLFTAHMLGNTEPSMPHVGVITNQATLTLQNRIVDYMNS